MLYVIILCLIIIGFLGYKLYQKQKIDKQELQDYQLQLKILKQDISNNWAEFNLSSQNLHEANLALKAAKKETDYEKYKLEECRKDLTAALDVYNDITENKLKEIDTSIEQQREQRQKELDQTFNEKKAYYNALLEETKIDCDKQCELVKQASTEIINQLQDDIQMYQRETQYEEERWNSIIKSSRLYEKEKQERLFYTIQLPEEFHEDIEFLLTTVAMKVQHPDIISKLVWAEYVKPYLDDTFKRIEIKPEPGIYKLTSLINNKCYVGKSTNVKTRIADHFKSVVGIKSIADQAVHHAILKEGFWNWQIEVITYCEKDKLSELEKYYIDFFKGQEYGYNKTGGG